MFPPVMGPVTVLRSGRTAFGDREVISSHIVEDCCWAPRSETEATDLRETAITNYWLFAPYGADIQLDDEVIIPKIVDADDHPVIWQVRGEAARWQSPWTQEEVGLQLQLERATG